MKLQTKRLFLRKVDRADAQAIVNAMECPAVHQMYSYGFSNPESVLNYIDVLTGEYENGNFRTLAIADSSTDQLIGSITLDILNIFSRAEFSYWIHKHYRNRGYATEAVRAMLNYCFYSLHLNRIQAMTNNPASERVLKKSGMSYEGTLRQYIGRDGIYWDMKMYSVLHRDFSHESPELYHSSPPH